MNILNEIKVMLQENTWMDATSKAKAIEKANYIEPQIGYPDYFDNATYVKKTFNVINHFIY
jgi:predicted metalloendopeptidase